MKTMFKAKLLTALILGLGISLLTISTAGAGNPITVTFTGNTRVTLDGAYYTIRTDAAVEGSMTITATVLTLTVPTDSTVRVVSDNGYALTNDGGFTITCSGGQSYITIVGADGVAIAVTPDKTTVSCTDSTGGGGGGGGGTALPDVTPPTNITVSINAGVAITNTASVTLTLGAVGASEMIIGNEPTFVGSNWVTFSTSKAWTLTTGNGIKTVYAKFKDAANNISAVVSDSITLDSTTEVIEPEPETPATGEQTQERATQVEQILSEASAVSTSSAQTMAQNSGTTRNLSLEQQYSSTIVDKVVPAGTTAQVRNQVVNFVTYGTATTHVLGAGERAGVVNSFRAAFGKVPTTESDWADVIKIANGRWPGTLNTERETTVASTFKKIYLRDANRANTHDDAAITVMAYGLRPLPRNLNSEKVAIKTFKYLFGKNPSTATDWDTVRAIAYSGATR